MYLLEHKLAFVLRNCGNKSVIIWLQPVTKAPCGHLCPRWGVEENRKKQAETGGSGLIQFNRTANKGNCNNNDTDKENTQHKKADRRQQISPPCHTRASEFPPLSPPPAGTQHDDTWCRIPCSVWPGWVSPPGCVPPWILVKINPVLAEPRTLYVRD